MMHELIQKIERSSFRMLPALAIRYYDGWVLRFASGYTRRANSVNPVHGSTIDIDEKIASCEHIYFHKKMDVHFKMTDAVYPADLDQCLDQNGYFRTSPIHVQVLDLETISPSFSQNAVLDENYHLKWFRDYFRLNDFPAEHQVTMQLVLARIDLPACYMRLRMNNRTAAVGLGVIDGDLLGLFDIVTDVQFRKQGHATELVNSLLHWGKTLGARQAYLQVETENEAAINLYKRFGFHNVYDYWYRTKEIDRSAT